MASPIILNSAFSVVSYNGGPLKGVNGIENLLKVLPGEKSRPISSRNGTNFDLVLEYKNPETSGPNKFTLTHVVVMAPDYSLVTAPTKNGMVWVIDAESTHSFAEFNDMTEGDYLTAEEKASPRPIFFDIRRHADDAVSVVPKDCKSTGNRVHIKFVSSHGDDGNIDMGPIYLLGFHGEAPDKYVPLSMDSQ